MVTFLFFLAFVLTSWNTNLKASKPCMPLRRSLLFSFLLLFSTLFCSCCHLQNRKFCFLNPVRFVLEFHAHHTLFPALKGCPSFCLHNCYCRDRKLEKGFRKFVFVWGQEVIWALVPSLLWISTHQKLSESFQLGMTLVMSVRTLFGSWADV